MQYKNFAIIAFLTIANKTIGQELPQGTFAFSTGFTYRQLTFKEKNKFSYLSSSCTGGQQGSGTYIFTGKKLTFAFENPTSRSLPLKPLINKQDNNGDTAFIYFDFYNPKDSTKIGGVTTKFFSKTAQIAYRALSDDSGRVRLKVAKNELPASIEVSYVGIDPQQILIDENGIYSVTFPLNFEFIKPLVKGDKLDFVIKNFSTQEITLKAANDDYKFNRYVKKSDSL